ncbi:hypothetical protein [Pectobacterium brasiliense]|uniref:hypothetical protein n=1 Tax=Pectobacterium brasiliense TaxID=180957 RepID=UPI001968B4B4|nr:hypothetical protein [Pectobacterium brasiliense]MBN3068141.1 hypothetical protein [Pectobacterium brasiliense]
MRNEIAEIDELAIANAAPKKIKTVPVKLKYWVHADGWIYCGDKTDGARSATTAEIDEHVSKLRNAGDELIATADQ